MVLGEISLHDISEPLRQLHDAEIDIACGEGLALFTEEEILLDSRAVLDALRNNSALILVPSCSGRGWSSRRGDGTES